MGAPPPETNRITNANGIALRFRGYHFTGRKTRRQVRLSELRECRHHHPQPRTYRHPVVNGPHVAMPSTRGRLRSSPLNLICVLSNAVSGRIFCITRRNPPLNLCRHYTRKLFLLETNPIRRPQSFISRLGRLLANSRKARWDSQCVSYGRDWCHSLFEGKLRGRSELRRRSVSARSGSVRGNW
jgi:hypothetical protein